MAANALTINLPADKRGLFSRAPLWFGKKGNKLSPATVAIVGKIFGLSRTKNAADASCWTNYDQLQEEFGLSRATVAKAITNLKENELIQIDCRDREGTSYKYIAEAGKRYDIIPSFLYTADCNYGEQRRLTKAQARILAHMMTEAKRPKNAGKYEGSIARIARALSLSETTVKKAVKVLLKARLIYRPAEDKGRNGHKLTIFHVNKELFEYEKYRKKVKIKEEIAPKAVQDVNARTDRQRYYDLRKAEMEARAEKYREKVYNAVPKFKEIEIEIKALQIPLAKAEVGNAATYPVLLSKLHGLNADRRMIMQRFNIEEDKLQAKHYAKCVRCYDSGTLADGMACSCFRRKEEL